MREQDYGCGCLYIYVDGPIVFYVIADGLWKTPVAAWALILAYIAGGIWMIASARRRNKTTMHGEEGRGIEIHREPGNWQECHDFDDFGDFDGGG